MDWSHMSLSRDRILSDSGEWDTRSGTWWHTPPLSANHMVPISFKASREYRRVWDVVTPSWKTKVNSGEIITNDLLDVSLKNVYSPFIFRAELCYPGQPYILCEDTFPLVADTVDFLPVSLPNTWEKAVAPMLTDGGSLRAEAVTSAYSRVDVSELEMLASLGEMPETVEWFGDVLRRLIALTVALKKRQYSDVMNHLKSLKTGKGFYRASKNMGSTAENTWMEWRYAIRPLIFEVQAYLAALDTSVEKATRKTARAKVLQAPTQITQVSPFNYGPFLYSPNVRQTVTTSRSIRAGVLFSLDPTKMGWWTHLGLDAPSSALWAVKSLSFVYDWFFNIGQWIASWEPRLGLTPLSSWVVETRSIEIEGIPMPTLVPFPPYTILSRSVIELGGYTCNVQTKARWANPDRQILPTFRLKGLDTSKVADLTVIGRKLVSQLLR